jgi:transcriptional regulator with XRE-family HTH domain
MKNYGYLNNLELQALCDKLGLTRKDLAEMCGVSVDSVKFWLTGKAKTTKEVCDMLLNLNRKINHVIKGAVESYNNAPKGAEVYLIAYNDDDESRAYLSKFFADLPTSAHTSMIQRAYCELVDKGADVHIVLFNPENYKDYLRTNKFFDTQDRRAEWACIRYKNIIN